MKRLLLLAAVALVAFLSFEVYLAGRNERAPPPHDTNITAEHGGRAYGERIKTRSWSLSYDRMVANADQTIVDLFGVRDGTIYNGGKPYFRVRAQHVSVNTITHDFSATGALHIETVDKKSPRAFDTNSALWNDASQHLTLPRQTTIRSGADAPLVVGSISLDVRTGEVDVRDISGAIRFK